VVRLAERLTEILRDMIQEGSEGKSGEEPSTSG